MFDPIVTLTLNPAIDMASQAHGVRQGHKARTVSDRIDPGGGGINAARMIQALDGESLAVILAGGVTGRYLHELLGSQRVRYLTVPISGRTRMNLTVHDRANGAEYRFVPQGPDVTESEWQAALNTLHRMNWQWLIASGSLPPGVPDDFYARTARLAGMRGAHFVLDTSGQPLRAALSSGIALMKPSLAELEYLCGQSLPARSEQAAAAVHMVRSGAAAMVALSLGEDGAILAHANEAIFMPALDVAVHSTVGAGDSFAGAMVLALSRGAAPEDALRWGAAAGAAAVSTAGTGQVPAEMVRALYAQTEGRTVRLKIG